MADRRVLFLCHNHPASRAGGAETYALELHRAMRATPGWDPTFVARGGPPLSRAGRPHDGTRFSLVEGTDDEFLLYTDGYDFDWLFGTMRHRKGLYTEDLRSLLLDLRPDVVHVQHTLFIGYDAIREVRRTLPDAAIVHTLHEFLPICHNKGQMVRTMDDRLCSEASPRRCNECFPDISPQTFYLRERFIKAQLGLVDLFVVPSALLRDRYVAWGIPPERVLLEEYGRSLPAEGRPPVGEEAGPGDRLGFFGQLHPYKGIDVLLDAMRRLIDDGGAVPRLRVHGANLDLQEHGYRDRILQGLAATRPHVSFSGPYPPERAPELMAAVDWVVVPSRWWENSPLVIQEAFAQGRPVICSDIGGMAEKVAHEVNGLHFRVGDPASLAETIRRATGTPGLHARLRAGIPPVHAMARHVRVLTAAYDRLLERRTAPLLA